MTPQELKASILQLAIQGKLVEHFVSEQPVAVDTSFSGDTSDFFEIPEKWKWLSIKDVASVNTGLSFKKQDQRDSSNGSLRVLRGGNIGDDYKYHLYDDDVYVDLDQFQTKYTQLLEGDIITPAVTSIEKICKTGFVDRNLHAITAGGFVYIIRCLDRSVVEPKYLLYFISSFFNKEQCKPNIHKSGQAFYNLKKSGFIEQPICIPPLAEQKRIVTKIEELLPLIDRYEAAWNKLEEFNKRFPGDMQKSILQLAIQGKLVEQRSEEGTGEELFQQIQAEKQALIKAGKIKKEKPLPEIADGELPFDIPNTWKWIRLIDLCKSISDGDHQPPPQVPIGIPFLVISNVSTGSIDFSNTRYVPQDYFDALSSDRVAEKGDILFTVTGSYGIPIKVDCEQQFCFQRHIALLKLLVDWDYLYFALISPVIKAQCDAVATGTAQKTVGLKSLRSMLVPLPPLAEQKRIVAKLEEILPLCDRLK